VGDVSHAKISAAPSRHAYISAWSIRWRGRVEAEPPEDPLRDSANESQMHDEGYAAIPSF